MANGTITLTSFIAYYGETSDLSIVGSKVDTPIPLPNRLGASSNDVGSGTGETIFPTKKSTSTALARREAAPTVSMCSPV
jgi:hypothetical protein